MIILDRRLQKLEENFAHASKELLISETKVVEELKKLKIIEEPSTLSAQDVSKTTTSPQLTPGTRLRTESIGGQRAFARRRAHYKRSSSTSKLTDKLVSHPDLIQDLQFAKKQREAQASKSSGTDSSSERLMSSTKSLEIPSLMSLESLTSSTSPRGSATPYQRGYVRADSLFISRIYFCMIFLKNSNES